MRLTKYPQSCLLVEVGDQRLLIDPGVFLSARFDLDELGRLDAVLVTHRLADHLDPDLLTPLREQGIPLYGNADVLALTGPEGTHEVRSGRPFTVGDVEVVPHDLDHVVLVDGSPGPPNTGFLIDDTLLHPGDGIELTGVTAPVLATPVAGPSISFHRAYRFVQQLGAQTVVPIHYAMFVVDPHHFARVCDLAEVVVLDDGASVEVGSHR